MPTRSEQSASDNLPVTAEAPSRLQPYHSPGGRKAKYRQIKVNIGFQQNGQETYIRQEGGRGVPPLQTPSTLTLPGSVFSLKSAANSLRSDIGLSCNALYPSKK
jgi:hypothetical protein